ncbi:peptide-methionine (S)-S-oxide reductase [Photobacterium jeanii]|uniref:Peptide methionine sulfoxide reductase MsrA n=1 Tax=Photobacterium jeanii TaxID=858640 RepID=A0A178KNX3_9GAMM|nr:peptide-methionine (S)-S-oxide reductase MsrA [Photobacterium jeanii]OAN19079.1 peptide-methionine (S)-S-oxide reductase [Photobacterium jeanii]PST87745.1 peptide-methionine (S)-S-oxide reductase MsrA [Photobacterium jeanii]
MTLTKQTMISQEAALIGRATPIIPSHRHIVLNTPLDDTIPDGLDSLIVGMGCFWGAERLFWQQEGVYSTAVGYCGGFTPNPSYEEVCSGKTGHTEVVKIIFDPSILPLSRLLALFWENHVPTEGMRQGNDIGTQYRSALYTHSSTQYDQAIKSLENYQQALAQHSDSAKITTEICPASTFYFAEDYHQQYLAKNPNGYCGLGGTGICFPPSLQP